MVLPLPEPASPRIHDDIAAINRLAPLGLTIEILTTAVEDAVALYNTVTSSYPPTAPGFFLWAATINSLRQQLVHHGWTDENDRNYPLVIAPDRKFALSAAGGDSGTGIKTRSVTTRTGKGIATRDAVSRNQGSFWDTDEGWAGGPGVSAIRQTWLLLIHVNPQGDVRAELSLPAGFGKGGRVTGWDERIILPLEDSRAVSVLTPAPSDDDEDDTEVKVERRD